MKLACLLLAALFLVGGCGSEESVTAGIDDNDSQDDVQARARMVADASAMWQSFFI